MSRDSFGQMPFSPRRLTPCTAAIKNELSQRDLPTHLGLAALFASTLDQLALAMAQLFREALRDDVYRLVKIMPVVFGMEIRSAQGEMHFHDKRMLGSSRAVVPKSDVRPD